MGKGKRKKVGRTTPQKKTSQISISKKSPSESVIKSGFSGIRFNLIICCFLALVTLTVYSNTLQSPFVFDDVEGITENPYIRIIDIDFQKLNSAAFKGVYYTRPVANISFALNYYFGRCDVFGYHLVNIIIHCINGILAYFIGLTIFSQMQPRHKKTLDEPNQDRVNLMAVFSALFFMVHPLQTEAVTYIIQRMTSISVMFFLLSLFLYIRGRLSHTGWRQWTLFFACFLSWVLALGSKQIAITLPLIVIIYEWYFFQDLDTGWLRGNVKYFLMLIVILCVLVVIYQGTNPIDRILAAYEHRDFTLWERVLTQFRVVIFYISLIFYPDPSRLNLLHHFTTSHSVLDPITTLFSMLTILVFVSLAFVFARRNRLISFCILWFFISLVLESSIIGLEMVYEHRLYLPMLGPALIISYLVFHLPFKRSAWGVVISSAIILSLGTAAYKRNMVWKDEVTLFLDCVKKSPQKARPHNNLSQAFLNQGNYREAERQAAEALLIKPDYDNAQNNLGAALLQQGKISEAVQHLSEALRINPDYGDAHSNLGVALLSEGKVMEAVNHFSAALRIKPHNAETHNNLAVALIKQGKIEEAIKHLSEALRINPKYENARINLSIAVGEQKSTAR